MKQIVIHVVGYPASGKTTLIRKLCKEFDLNVIDGNPIRNLLNKEIKYYDNDRVGQSKPINESFARVVNTWRVSLLDELLAQGQSVIIEGGINAQSRNRYKTLIRRKYPEMKIVFIHIQIDESELLKRLEARGRDWVDLYKNHFRRVVGSPQSNECDNLIIFDQRNTDEVIKQIEQFIGRI